MKKTISSLLCLLILTCSQIALSANAMQLEIIPLKHRLANDIISILQPLVVEGGSLSGMNNQLIIRTTKQNLQELRKVLTAIDKPLRSLKITVRFDQQDAHQTHSHGIDGHYATKNTRVSTVTPPQQQGTSVTIKNNNDALRYRSWNTETQTDDDNIYFVRTVEGQEAWINIGQVVPRAYNTVYLHPYSVDIYESIEYQDISSGFYVEPTLTEQQVTLQISPQQSRLSQTHPDRTETQEAHMTVTGKLGEWIDLGGISGETTAHDQHGTYMTRKVGNNESRIFVRIEEYH